MNTSGKFLITGAASGIGRAVALRLAGAHGVRLVLVDRDEAGLLALSNEVAKERHAFLAMDVALESNWQKAAGILAGLDGAVACAGISAAQPVTEMTLDTWRKVMTVNLDGMFLTLQASLKSMKDGGSFVAMSSATAQKAAPMTAAYGASKAGLEQLIKVAALEAAPRNITVNALAPGGVKTPMFSSQDAFQSQARDEGESAAWASLAGATPLKRFADADEIAALAVTVLTGSAGLMTGSVISCDGGYGIS